MGYQWDGPMWLLGWCDAPWHIKSIPAAPPTACSGAAAVNYNGSLINGTHKTILFHFSFFFNFFLYGYACISFYFLFFSLFFYSICNSFSI
jgi:hypothetical protein